MAGRILYKNMIHLSYSNYKERGDFLWLRKNFRSDVVPMVLDS